MSRPPRPHRLMHVAALYCLLAASALPSVSLAQTTANATSAASLATRFFDFAERSQYKSYFPSGPVTQSAFPFSYRYYSATGVYLGVANGNSPVYPDGIYLMGGAFGNTPKFVGPLTNFIAYDPQVIAGGGGYTMVVDSSNTLWGVGSNNWGQLGDGTTNIKYNVIQVATDVTSVVTGESTTYFLKKDGSLWGMGKYVPSFLTTPPVTNQRQLTPVKIATDVIAVSSEPGGVHTLFLKADKTLWGLGINYEGELGPNYNSSLLTAPVKVASDVTSFSAGDASTFFVKSDRSLWAMGLNTWGQLGDGTTTRRTAPVQIATGVAAVSAGNYFTFFIKTDSASVKTPGTLWAMGLNTYGQLGDGTTTNRSTPVQVATGVESVSVGQYSAHFIKTDGSLWSVGSNGSGQLGDGTRTDRKSPVQVATNVALVNEGEFHTMFVKKDGTVWGMGDNGGGTLGDGSLIERTSPVRIFGNVTVTLP